MRKVLSAGEEEFWLHCKLLRLRQLPERQYAWAADVGRRFVADFAWPERRLIVEIDGSVHRIRGRFRASMERDNLAQALGWMQLKFSPADVKSGKAINAVRAALEKNTDLLVEVLQGRKKCTRQTKTGSAKTSARAALVPPHSRFSSLCSSLRYSLPSR